MNCPVWTFTVAANDSSEETHVRMQQLVHECEGVVRQKKIMDNNTVRHENYYWSSKYYDLYLSPDIIIVRKITYHISELFPKHVCKVYLNIILSPSTDELDSGVYLDPDVISAIKSVEGSVDVSVNRM
jgi:hypothetical protein